MRLSLHDAFTPSAIEDAAMIEDLRSRLPLTAREGEVMLWISRGKTTLEMGEILGISPRTVDKHLEQIYRKVGVETRAAAAVTAIQAILGVRRQ